MYRIALSDDVLAEVARFSPVTLRYWSVCLNELARDPLPRFGQYVERVVPIRGFPLRTYNFWITEERSVSGERLFVFFSEFLPEVSPLYVVDEEGREVEVFSLREGWV